MSNFDWTGWSKRLSTLVAALSAAAAATLGYYATLSDALKAEWPWWAPLLLTIAPVVIPFFVPAATSYKQQSLAKDDSDQAGA